MHSYTSTVLFALSGLIVYAVAQNTNGTAGTSFTIDVGSVPLATRATWCQGETDTCGTLCDPGPKENTCSPDTLEFSCICQNGTAPDLAAYTASMPSFICEQAFSDCITQNTQSQEGQTGCTNNIKEHCGTLDANGPRTTTSVGSSATGTSSSSGSGSSAPTSSSHAAAQTNMAHYGNGAAAVVAIGLLAYLV